MKYKTSRAERRHEIELKEKENLQRIFNSLKAIDHMKDKVNDSKNFIDIQFNEFLWIHGHTDILYVNNDKNHIHFDDDIDAIIEWLTAIARGNIVFVEDRCWFSPKRLIGLFLQPWNLKDLTSIKFEKNKDKYLRRRYSRIYSGLGIIKRAINDKMPSFVKSETPPKPCMHEDMVDVIWNNDKTAFCEVLFKNASYKVTDVRYLDYDEFSGYYWNVSSHSTVSLFDTLEKARKLAQEIVSELSINKYYQ